jgi:hypothetical protein
MVTNRMAVPDKYLSMALAEAMEINARVAMRRAELMERAQQLEFELGQIRAALSAMPTPSNEPVDAFLVSDERELFASPGQLVSASQRILAMLQVAREPLASSEIMERLYTNGLPLSPGVVHTTLSRLQERGEVIAIGERGERKYTCGVGPTNDETRRTVWQLSVKRRDK